MKVELFDKNGIQTSKLELNSLVFGRNPNDALLGQYIRVFTHNQRHGTSSSKTRAEVSGGGKKPWKQKGLGRARHGSIRSPLWRHGGIVHGPKPKSWNLTMPKKMRRLALQIALSLKARSSNVKIIEAFEVKEVKTSYLANIVKKLYSDARKVLIVLDNSDQNAIVSARNLPWVSTALWENLNAYDIISAEKIIFTKDALDKLEKRYETK